LALTLVAGAHQDAAAARLIPDSFAELAQKASPAVVNVYTKRISRAPSRSGPRSDQRMPDDFYDFFERYFGRQFPPSDREQQSLGSGFVVEPDGYIITNSHVIEQADEVRVRLSSGKDYKARIVGADPKTDLALIKIVVEKPLPILKLGDSDKVRVGDWVVAIGNPFGLDHTVTAGIISAKGRNIQAGPYDDFIQTDASINPGNSGGPLLDLAGDVVGINTAIAAAGQGIGFAIPTNLARGIVSQLREKGRVVRGWLGVVIQKVTPHLAESFHLAAAEGALVADVDSDGPARKAGIRRGDVIVAFNGSRIREFSELSVLVANAAIGSTAEVQLIRAGKTKGIRVVVGELKEETAAAEPARQQSDLGLVVEELTPDLADRLGVKSGVIVTDIAEGSPAADAGLRPGDLVVQINNQDVPSLDKYRVITRDLKKKDVVLFLVKRGGNTLYFTMKMG
jgi:serine protease Do